MEEFSRVAGRSGSVAGRRIAARERLEAGEREWNPHHESSPQRLARRSQRLKEVEAYRLAKAEEDAKTAADKAAKKKKKRDGRKRKKTEEEAIKRIEDTDHVDDEDVQFNPSPAAPLSRQNRVRSEPPEWYQDLELPTKPPLAPRDSVCQQPCCTRPLELPPELPLAESRTSSASSSGSSSFESVQEDEDTDQPAKKQRTQSVFT